MTRRILLGVLFSLVGALAILAIATDWAASIGLADTSGWVSVPVIAVEVRPPWLVFVWYAHALHRGFGAMSAWGQPNLWGTRPTFPTPAPAGPLLLACGGLLVALMGSVWAVRGRWGRRSSLRADVHGGARFATTDDLQHWMRRHRQGVVLGRWQRDILYSGGQEHVLLVGPTESGKTLSTAIPSVRSWPDSLVILDIKGEIAQATIEQRAEFGPVFIWNPSAADSIGLNPLDSIRVGSPSQFDDARTLAHALVVPGNPPHWHLAAEPLLEAGILHLCHGGGKASLAGLHDLFATPIVKALQAMAQSTIPEVRQEAVKMRGRSENEAGGVWSTAGTFLSLYRGYVGAATDASDVQGGQLTHGEEPITLYLHLEPHMLASLAPLVRIILTSMVGSLTTAGEDYRRRVLFLLDEFPQLDYCQVVEKGVSFLRSYGVKFLLIAQSLQQLYAHYGEHTTILDNCGVQVFYGSNDLRTNEYLSKQLGQTTIRQDVTRLSGRRFAWRATQQSTMPQDIGRPLRFPDELRLLSDDQELVLIQGMPALLAQKLITPNKGLRMSGKAHHDKD